MFCFHELKSWSWLHDLWTISWFRCVATPLRNGPFTCPDLKSAYHANFAIIAVHPTQKRRANWQYTSSPSPHHCDMLRLPTIGRAASSGLTSDKKHGIASTHSLTVATGIEVTASEWLIWLPLTEGIQSVIGAWTAEVFIWMKVFVWMIPKQ